MGKAQRLARLKRAVAIDAVTLVVVLAGLAVTLWSAFDPSVERLWAAALFLVALVLNQLARRLD